MGICSLKEGQIYKNWCDFTEKLLSSYIRYNYYCYVFFSVPVKLREVHLKPNSVPSTTDSAEDGSVSTSEELIFYCFPMLDGIVDPHTVIGKKHA